MGDAKNGPDRRLDRFRKLKWLPLSVAFTSARVIASGSLTKSDFSALYIGLKLRATKNQPMESQRFRFRSFQSRLFARQ